nr:hypothetical protein [Atopobium sp. oral taxon 416]
MQRHASIAGTMDGYSHLSIEKREDIMVCWKGHEGISQIRGSSDGTSRPYLARSGATDGRGLPRIERAEACGCKAAALQAPGSWTIRIGARWSVRLMRDEHWSSKGISGLHRDAVLRPCRKRRQHLAHRVVVIARLRAFRAQEGHKVAQPSRQVQAQQGQPEAHRQAAHHPRHLEAPERGILQEPDR